jgi:hypothetical protein
MTLFRSVSVYFGLRSRPIRRMSIGWNVSMTRFLYLSRTPLCNQVNGSPRRKSRPIELLHTKPAEMHAEQSAYSFFASYLSLSLSPLSAATAAAAPLCYLARLHCVCVCAALQPHAARAINLLFLSIVGSVAIKSVCVHKRGTCVVCTAARRSHPDIHFFRRMQVLRSKVSKSQVSDIILLSPTTDRTHKSQTARAARAKQRRASVSFSLSVPL